MTSRGTAMAAASPSAAVSAEATAELRTIFGDVCAICQEEVDMRGKLDSCAHLFCLPCVKKWAKIETRCPLCKARFTFIQPEDMTSPPAPECFPIGDGGGDGVIAARATRPRKKRAPLRRIYLPHRDQVYEDPDGGGDASRATPPRSFSDREMFVPCSMVFTHTVLVRALLWSG